jgi:hypothetical protein
MAHFVANRCHTPSACAGILEVAAGRVPPHLVNREVQGQPLLLEKLRRIGLRRGRA